MKKTYVFMMLLLALGMGLKSCSCNSEQKDQQELEDLQIKLAGQRKAAEIVNGWINNRSITTDVQKSTYYIDTEFWNNKTYQEKEIVVKTLVLYDESKNVNAVSSLILLDKMSGKKLASFTDFGGMDIATD